MGFKYLNETDNEISCNCFKWSRRGQGGDTMGVIQPMYNISLFGTVTMNISLYNKYILIFKN
jgi:hypothetical protein